MAGRRMKETRTNKIEMFGRGFFSAKAENSRYVKMHFFAKVESSAKNDSEEGEQA